MRWKADAAARRDLGYRPTWFETTDAALSTEGLGAVSKFRIPAVQKVLC
jgi:hypothetical protein